MRRSSISPSNERLPSHCPTQNVPNASRLKLKAPCGLSARDIGEKPSALPRPPRPFRKMRTPSSSHVTARWFQSSSGAAPPHTAYPSASSAWSARRRSAHHQNMSCPDPMRGRVFGFGFANNIRQTSFPFASYPLSGHSRLNQRLTVPRSCVRLPAAA